MKNDGKVKKWIKEHRFELELAGELTLGFAVGWALGRKGIRLRDEIRLVKPPRISMGQIESSVAKKQAAVKAAVLHQEPRLTARDANGFVETAAEFCEKTASEVEAYVPSAPFEVRQHIRNLHEGCKASATKIAEAAAQDIPLLPGQTLVNAYQKGLPAA